MKLVSKVLRQQLENVYRLNLFRSGLMLCRLFGDYFKDTSSLSCLCPYTLLYSAPKGALVNISAFILRKHSLIIVLNQEPNKYVVCCQFRRQIFPGHIIKWWGNLKIWLPSSKAFLSLAFGTKEKCNPHFHSPLFSWMCVSLTAQFAKLNRFSARFHSKNSN